MNSIASGSAKKIVEIHRTGLEPEPKSIAGLQRGRAEKYIAGQATFGMARIFIRAGFS